MYVVGREMLYKIICLYLGPSPAIHHKYCMCKTYIAGQIVNMTLLFELDVQLLLTLMDLFSIVDIIVACRFTNAVDPKGFSYDYNPCSTFSDTAACTDVYVSIITMGLYIQSLLIFYPNLYYMI